MAIPVADKAKFVQPSSGASGAKIAPQKITLQTGSMIDVGVAYKRTPVPSFTANAGVQVVEDGASRFVGRVQFAITGFQGDVTIYRITGFRPGPVRLLLMEGATLLDSVEFNVVGQEISAMTVLDALEHHRIVANPSDMAVLRSSVTGGSKTVIVDSLIIDLVAALVRVGDLGILSLLRRGEGQHGVVVGDKVFVRAIDISMFNNIDVISNDGEKLVDLICEILKLFPEGGFDLGFPRPVGGPKGFDKSHDVFFSVPDEATAQQCFAGTISRSLQQMLQPARDKVTAAMKAAKGNFHVLFPDGLNHLHVAVTRTKDIKVDLST